MVGHSQHLSKSLQPRTTANDRTDATCCHLSLRCCQQPRSAGTPSGSDTALDSAAAAAARLAATSATADPPTALRPGHRVELGHLVPHSSIDSGASCVLCHGAGEKGGPLGWVACITTASPWKLPNTEVSSLGRPTSVWHLTDCLRSWHTYMNHACAHAVCCASTNA